MLNKRKMILALLVMTLLGTIPMMTLAAEPSANEVLLEDGNYRQSIQDEYNVDEISSIYKVDPEELTTAIIEGKNSNKFSPFSELKIIGKAKKNTFSVNSEEKIYTTNSLEYTVYNQDSTAYLATGNAGASGTMPWVGSCAVHKVSTTNSTPIIPFGTTVSYLNRSVTIGGNSYSAFVVNDTGDASFKRSLYWTDIYFGANTTANYKAAINYGIKQDVTLYWLR